MIKKCRFVWQICIFYVPLPPNNQKSNKKWTITRRIITIRKAGEQQARPLILLPLNYFKGLAR